MKTIALAALLSFVGGCYTGCAHKKPEEDLEPAPAAPAAPAVPGKPLDAHALGQRMIDCWGFFNENKWDDYKGCYMPDATVVDPGNAAIHAGKPLQGADLIVAGDQQGKVGVPDMKGDVRLVLVHGHDVVAALAMTGTHTGPLAEVTEMNQKIGFLAVDIRTFDDVGRTIHESNYSDDATFNKQLEPDPAFAVRAATAIPDVPREFVVAKDDAGEQANVAVVQQLHRAIDKHDLKALGALLAADVTWVDTAATKDWAKADVLAYFAGLWRAFSDVHVTTTSLWGAGTYVAFVGSLDGTNDGAWPERHVKAATHAKAALPVIAIYKLDGGKVKQAWVFASSFVLIDELETAAAGSAGAGSAARSGSAAAGSAAAGSAAAGSAAAGSATK